MSAYIIRVNDFNKFSKVPLEQWIYFLNTGEIPDEADAPGLGEARQQLKLDTMSEAELNDYYRHLDDAVILRDVVTTGREEGRMEGRAEGCAEEKRELARNFKALGVDFDTIARATGLTIEEIGQL